MVDLYRCCRLCIFYIWQQLSTSEGRRLLHMTSSLDPDLFDAEGSGSSDNNNKPSASSSESESDEQIDEETVNKLSSKFSGVSWRDSTRCDFEIFFPSHDFHKNIAVTVQEKHLVLCWFKHGSVLIKLAQCLLLYNLPNKSMTIILSQRYSLYFF